MSHKIALITGGSRGLGRSAALHLARQGVDSLITYRAGADAAAGVVAGVQALGARAVALPLDTGCLAQFPDFVAALRGALREHWQREDFDFLLNNAGTGANASIAETTEAEFDELMAVHFKGVFFLTQALLPLLADGGRILNVSSGLTRFTQPGKAAYASMKGAIEVFTRYLAAELGGRGITVNTIAPGAIATDFGGGIVRDNPQVNAHIARVTALGRAGLPEDIGGAVAALFAGETGWINAQRIEASGGMFV